MPTYRNPGPGVYSEYDYNNKMRNVPPGDTIQTYKILGAPWVEISEDPVYNPVVFSQVVTLTADGSGNSKIDFDPSVVKLLRVTEVSDKIFSIHTQRANVLPPLYENVTSGATWTPEYRNTDGTVRRLVFCGSGTCKVTGLKQ